MKAKDEREIRTNDPELKAINMIRKAIAGLDTQPALRVLHFCIDRVRDDCGSVNKPYLGTTAAPNEPLRINSALEPYLGAPWAQTGSPTR